MPVKSITSRENPQYRALLALADHGQSRREAGRTLLDGEHLLGDALDAGLEPSLLAFSEAAPAMLAWHDRLPEVPAIRLSANLFKRLSPVATPSGIVSVIDIPRSAPTDAGEFVLMLEDIQDPGNLGALLRSAAAAGVDTVYLSRGCAEAWSPKTLRGGQGGHFRLVIVENVNLPEAIGAFPGTVYAAKLGDNRGLFDLPLSGQIAFLFGNEGAGLSPEVVAEATPFTIPMPGRIESLNVAAAAAVCLFERVRQRVVSMG